MSLRLVQSDLHERCLRLARLIADQLANQQCENGDFPQHSFYAKAYAVALWQNLGDDHYTAKIRAAVNALKTEIQDHRYHREFIEYALENCPNINAETRNAILRNAHTNRPMSQTGTSLQCASANPVHGGINCVQNWTGFIFIPASGAHQSSWTGPAVFPRNIMPSVPPC